MSVDYKNEYRKDVLMTYDGSKHLERLCIKYGDALAGVCYAMDIPYNKITKQWPSVAQNEMWIGGNIYDQIEFIKQNAKRKPKHILEIGAGRGEVTLMLSKMGYQVTTIDPGKDFIELLEYSNKKLFPNEQITPYKIINESLQLANLDYSQFDTILMVESLEHILAEHFDPEWNKINHQFTGYFIVVNWKRYHPIAVGQYAPPNIHCRRTDDALYDSFIKDNKCLLRDGSHLVVEIDNENT